MEDIQVLSQLLADPSMAPARRAQCEEVLQRLRQEAKRNAFLIEKLQENWKITENFLNKAVQELEENNQELELVNNQLTATNKELEEFAYIISHDLQEPLHTILSFVDLLERRKSDLLDDKTKTYLEFISRSSVRLSNLIRAILDYSRIGKTGEPVRIDCNRLVEEVSLDLSIKIIEKQALITKDPLPEVFGLRDELHSLFQNLMANSLKYAKEGEKPLIHIACEPVDADWQFAVSDNGNGFDPQYKDRIFVIFQRLHHPMDTDGSGIGLSRCKKIVELHGGKIWAESRPGVGSTFYFTLSNSAFHEKV